MAKKRVADILIETLEGIGVKRIYGVIGDSLNGIISSIHKRNLIEWMHVRHEETAAFSAGAEAQLTGELSVCAGSCGPGNLHLINGLYDAHRSGAPVLAIAAHIPSVEVGGNYFQETNPHAVFKDCSCFCETVTGGEQLPRLLNIAIQTALTKKGVAVLVLSGDIALQEVDDLLKLDALPRAANPVITPSVNELLDIAALLNSSKKTTLFCGHGCAKAHDEVVSLAAKLNAPVVHALRGKECIEYDNPYDVGMTGLIGFASGYFAMEDCDTLLLLGTSFPYRNFYPKNAKIIQIDINGANLGRRAPVEIGVVGDIAPTLTALLPLIEQKTDSTFLDKARNHYQKARKDLDALAVGTPSKEGRVHPQYLAKLISDLATDNAVFTCDVGTQTAWAARYLKMNGKRRLLGSFNHGSMANALSQAIGAQAVDKSRQIIAMCGDGGFAMLMGDVLTLTQKKLPVKVVILNNSVLGFVQLEMIACGLMNYDVDLQNPNFAKLGEAIGIKGIRVEDPSQLEQGLKSAFAHDGPVIVDVVSHTYELIMPPTIAMSQVKGFSLFALKAVMNGDGNTLIDLAKTNLWH